MMSDACDDCGEVKPIEVRYGGSGPNGGWEDGKLCWGCFEKRGEKLRESFRAWASALKKKEEEKK